jgi:hypothetical protein
MKLILSTRIITTLAIIIIASFAITANASLEFQPPFAPYMTVSAGSNSIAITDNTTSFDINCTQTSGACVIGVAFTLRPDTFMQNTRRLVVTYQVMSVSTPTKCQIGVISAARTIAGAVNVTATTTQTTANFNHSIASAVDSFGFGIISNDTSNPCTMTLRVTEIKDVNGKILWSPQLNGIPTASSTPSGTSTYSEISSTTIQQGLKDTNTIIYLLLTILSIITILELSTQLRNQYSKKY